MGQRSAASSRAAERSAMMQQKRKIVDNVRVRFARFGDEVLSIVLAFALQPRSMPILMQRLNLRPVGTLDAQLDAIWEYIAQASAKEFLKHVKRVQKKDVQQFDLEKLLAGAAQELGSGEAAAGAEAGKPSAGAAEAPGGPVIKTPSYEGVDRRSGEDRRQRKDRRHDIEAIERNRRYGGERRKRPRGRRKTDY